MLAVYLCLTTRHDWRLVTVALAACALASFTAFVLFARTPPGPKLRSIRWIFAVSLVAGSGVWTTHFVSMLAFRTGLPERYDVGPTLGSFVAAVAAAAAGFGLAAHPGKGRRLLAQRLSGGLALGLGVSAMHYLGMAGYRTVGVLAWNAEMVAASVVIGVILSAAALCTAWPGAGLRRQLSGAVLFMMGVGGVHFIGMAAVKVLPDASEILPPALMSQTVMAVLAVVMMVLILVAAAVAAMLDVVGRNHDLKRLGEALDAMPDGLAFYDASDRLVAWNARYAEYWKGTGRLIAGRTFTEMLREGAAKGVYHDARTRAGAYVAERLAHRGVASGHIERQRSDGHWMRIYDRRTADGGTVSVVTDVTDRKQAEAAMVQANDLAQETIRIKSEFLANMSHEIRTPMNGIMGMNALMMMTELTPAQRRYAEVVQASAHSLLGIFDNILDIAKLEAGGVEIASIGFSLDALLGEVAAEARPQAERKGLELAVQIDGPSWPSVMGDPGRIRKVLGILVGNAIKFTESGAVLVDLRRRAADPDRTALRIEVADTGVGIDPEARENLFEPFRQADGSMTRQYGGLGLGLAICRHAVRLMSGDIGVDDRPGGGSIFWVELTLPNGPAKERSEAAA